MKVVIALVLIAVGILGLAYGGFSYMYNDPIDIGPIHTSIEREKEIPISPLVGGIAVAAGVGLLIWNNDKKK